MEIRCQNTYDPVFHLLTKCVITEPDGTKREICPLFYCQMIRERNGRFFYDRAMPGDYFAKAKMLEENGWSTWYHYDNWINDSVKNPEHEGYRTNEALEKCLTTGST
jgi:hypothetical protein